MLGLTPAESAMGCSIRTAQAEDQRRLFMEEMLPDLLLIDRDRLRSFQDGVYLAQLVDSHREKNTTIANGGRFA